MKIKSYDAAPGRSSVRIAPFRSAQRAWALGTLLFTRPEVWKLVGKPFIHAHWGAKERVQRLLDHHIIARRLGRPFNLPLNNFADIIVLEEISPSYRLKIDNPKWVLEDGLLTLSIWDEADRLFSIHFIFGYRDHETVAYIGGVQGRRGENVRDQYRAFAKDAEDLHPSHILVELFRSLCATIGINRILAVSNECRHQQARYFSQRRGYADPVSLDYNSLWHERGGVLLEDLYDLSLILPERDLATVRRNKRGRHSARRLLYTLLQSRLQEALNNPGRTAIFRHDTTLSNTSSRFRRTLA